MNAHIKVLLLERRKHNDGLKEKKRRALGRKSKLVEGESKSGSRFSYHPPATPEGLNVWLTMSIYVRQKIMGFRN